MRSEIKIDSCNCDQSLSLEKELFELKALLQEMNHRHPVEMKKESGGLHIHSNGTATLYPVGIAKYRLQAVRIKGMGKEITYLKNLTQYSISLLEKNDIEISDLKKGIKSQ